MIHYHGMPITPTTAAAKAVFSGHAFVSFRYPEQLGIVLDVAQSFAVDNGAFSAWRSGAPVTDWNEYYAWVAELHRYPAFDFAVIPDVIDGDEAANDILVAEWPWRERAPWVGAPVWHLHESLERLERLSLAWPRVCLGSSGEFAQIGTARWWTRMSQAMDTVCDREGRPVCKLHGLRMEIDSAHKMIVRSFFGHGSDSATRGCRTGFRSKLTDGRGLPSAEWSRWADAIPSFTRRLQGVLLENRDALEVIGRMDNPNALIYADPPYAHSTRSAIMGRSAKTHGYRHEMTDDDHRALAAVLHTSSAMVVLSGYPSALYDEELFADWDRYERRHMADGGRARTEVIWLNPACSAALDRQRAQMELIA